VATIILIALILGGTLGSIINMLATRLPADLGLLGSPLRPSDSRATRRGLIPFTGAYHPDTRVLDWPKVSTELAAAALVGATLFMQDSAFDIVRSITYAVILLTILRIDWQNHLIYLITIVPGIVIALGFSAAVSVDSLLSAGAAGVGAAFIFLLLFMLAFAIYKQRALGLGDVFLAGLIGTMTGLQGVGSALLLGMFLAAAGGLFLIAIRVRKRTDYIPYGAYLCIGALVVVLLQ
jgi:leader peptidase (prepilin peptidase)/N-methyltransferase